jgi:D-arabinose 1-dehydrogenase-like Zn-dependent alcohol dehydrogenase
MAYQEALPESCMAAVVAEFNQPVELRELPVPELEHGALLVRIEAATVCGTDLHIWDGAFGAGGIGQVNLPIVPGHEMVGRVAAFGPGEHADVTGSELKIGDRIVFTPGRCGSCHHCTVAGQPNLCMKRIGYGRQSIVFPYLVGGFAEYCYVYPTSSRIRVPGEVKPEWASAASCALRSVITGFGQLGAIEPWQTVVVQGSGRRTKDEYDFDQILSGRFRLDQVTDAFHGMQSMQEIKPVVIPEFA